MRYKLDPLSPNGVSRLEQTIIYQGSNTTQSSAPGSGLADPGSNGMLARTALNTTVARTLTGTANQVIITNGDGVSGDPTFSLPQSIDTGATVQFGRVNTPQIANIVSANNSTMNFGTWKLDD